MYSQQLHSYMLIYISKFLLIFSIAQYLQLTGAGNSFKLKAPTPPLKMLSTFASPLLILKILLLPLS